MLDSRKTQNSMHLIESGRISSLCAFIVAKILATAQGFVMTMEKSLRLIPQYILNRPKDFINCSAIYVAVAIIVELLQGKLPAFRMLVTSALVGGIISPFVIPWVRAFPLTGNPALSGIRRLVDFSFNILAHFVSLSLFVWSLKVFLAVIAFQIFALPWDIPGLFEAGLAFVLVNNFRKVATEYLGIKVFILWHPQGHEEIARAAARYPHFNAEQHRLVAWNFWREIGNGYAFWKSSRERPIGVQYWIAISKILDSIAIVF